MKASITKALNEQLVLALLSPVMNGRKNLAWFFK